MAKFDTRQPAGCLSPGTGAFPECLLDEVFLYISMNVYIVWMQVVPGGVDGEKLAKRKVEYGRGGWLHKVDEVYDVRNYGRSSR